MKRDYREWVDTVNLLRDNGYKVVVVHWRGKDYDYWEAKTRSKGILCCFCTDDNDVKHHVRWKITFDNARCFDKWSRCPVQSLPFPTEDWQKKQLLEWLAFWGTEEGYKRSNEYDYVVVTNYEL